MSADLEWLILATWNSDDPAGSAAAFASAADGAGSVADAIVLRTQQARAIGLAGDFHSAAELLDECDQSLTAAVDSMGTERAGGEPLAGLVAERSRLDAV